MRDWKKTVIASTISIIEALRVIDASALQVALVTDENYRLLGVVTDGDIRRAILQGISLDSPVSQVMNLDFTTVKGSTTEEEIIEIMQQKDIRHLPVVDDAGCLIGLKVLRDLLEKPAKSNPVLLMVGGKGLRLHPLTENCPKPLLNVGDKPLLETILKRFIESGFKKFYMSVNYRAEMIHEYFGDGSRWGVEINYLSEAEPLGTAGSLTLLPPLPADPLIVMNGDVLTNINFQHLLESHQTHKAKATVSIIEYEFQVPYGVVQTNHHLLTGLVEKPVYRFFVNAGIYVLNPEVIKLVPRNTFFNMDRLIETLSTQGEQVAVFPIHEYWVDVGKLGDFEKANNEFHKIF